MARGDDPAAGPRDASTATEPRPLARAAAPTVSGKAILAGLIALVLLQLGGFLAEVLYDLGNLTGGVPGPGPLASLVVLTALSALIARVARRASFSRTEVLISFVIVLAGAPLTSLGILAYMLPHAIYVPYAAQARPDWQTAIMPLFPSWFSPTRPEAVVAFFLGDGRVPWQDWAVPLAAWSSFLLALMGASCSLALLLARQWIGYERLSFPLAQIPLRAVNTDPSGRATLPVAGVFWLGLVISLGLRCWNSLASFVPAIPTIPLGPTPLIGEQSGPAAALGRLELVLWPWLVAIAYLVPKELSFSCWVFWFARVALAYIAICAGAMPRAPEGWLGDPAFPAFAFQGFGAIVALSGWALWGARRHLRYAVRAALRGSLSGAGESDDLPYRWVLVILVLCWSWLVGFCVFAGCRIQVAIGLTGLILLYYLMWTWLRAETGLGLLLFPLMVDDMIRALGQVALRPQEIVAICSLRWTYFPGGGSSAHIVAGNLLEGVKIADAASIPLRPLVTAAAGSIVAALAVGCYVTLTGYYRFGFIGVGATRDGWLASQVVWGAESIRVYLSDPSRFDPRAVAGMGAGAAVALGLGVLRSRFSWWPLHPAGFLASQSWGMHWYYGPFLLGWAAKALVIRYGSVRVYRQSVPFAVGLVLGDVLGQVLRLLVAPMAGAT